MLLGRGGNRWSINISNQSINQSINRGKLIKRQNSEKEKSGKKKGKKEKRKKGKKEKKKKSIFLQLILALAGGADALGDHPLFKHLLELAEQAVAGKVGQDDGVLDEQVPILAVVLVQRHALAPDDIDVAWLDDFALLAAQADNVPVEVGEFPRPPAEQGFPEGEDLLPEQVVAFTPEEDAVCRAVLLGARVHVGVFLVQADDKIAGNVVRVLIRLVFIGDAGAPGSATLDGYVVRRDTADDFGALTDIARVCDGLAFPSASFTHRLHLLEESRGNHVFLDSDPPPAALVALVCLPILRP